MRLISSVVLVVVKNIFHLTLKVTVQNAEPLDMVWNAVDDRYSGCRDQAFKKFIRGGLLKEELKRNGDFSYAWNPQEECPSASGLSKEHIAALVVSDSDGNFMNNFNAEVKTLGADAKTYNDQFHFKSLHFLLMDSLREQRPQDCKVVYAAVDRHYTAAKGSMVRLGQFIKAFSSFEALQENTDLSEMFIFNITSCYFAKLGANVCSTDDSVLVSPAETFTVVEVVHNSRDDTDYHVMILKHAKLVSAHNCYIFSR